MGGWRLSEIELIKDGRMEGKGRGGVDEGMGVVLLC